MFRRLDSRTVVCGQLSPDRLAEAGATGITRVVNNRPDGEAPGQPSSAEMAAAAQAAGIDYHHIPVRGGFSAELIEAMAEALAGDGQTLIFCTSGTRSTYLWAMVRAAQGEDTEALVAAAAEAGYDLAPLRPYLGG